jgi:fimbrial chaperone protein
MTAFMTPFGRCCALLLGGLLAAAGTAAASTFNIAPIRLEMDRSHQTGVLTLHNDGDAPLTIEVRSVAWSQDQGSDHYDPTGELIVTPPVFVVPAHTDQIVRVARRGGADGQRERTYRLFFEEVPAAAPAGFIGLKVALRIGIPVFFAAPAAKPELAFSASWRADGTLDLAAQNRGLAHFQITDFELAAPDATVVARVGGSRYVLGGSEAHWSLTPAGGAGRAEKLRINGHGDGGAIAAEVAVAYP